MRVILAGIINWQGQFTESCARALESLGIEYAIAPTADYLIQYDTSLLGRLKRRIPGVVRSQCAEYPSLIGGIFEQMDRPHDAVLVVGGQHLGRATIEQMRARCDRTKARLAIWLYDDPFMQWSPPVARHDLLKACGCFDHTFVFDSYHIPKMVSWGFRNVKLLSLASDRHVFHARSISESDAGRYRADVSFVGVPNPSRDQVLLNLLDFDVALYGATSYVDKRLKKLVRGTLVPLETTAVIYAASKIVLNINHPQSIFGSNCRTYDAALSGSVCLTDRKRDLEQQFVEGEELLFYDRPEDVAPIVASLLGDPTKRQAIARRGQQRVLAEHTFEHRMTRALELIGS